MIHELAILIAYGLLVPAKVLIIEATDAHLVHFHAFIHSKNLEIRGPLCDIHAV